MKCLCRGHVALKNTAQSALGQAIFIYIAHLEITYVGKSAVISKSTEMYK